LIGSIVGVGIANALMQGRDGTAGVDWSQAVNVGYALLLSPIIGFICAALLLLTLKYLVRKPSLYQEPKGATPPPLWIRAILVLTCTGVSSWLKRWSEGHGPHHVDPDRLRADRLCLEPRHA